MLRIGPHNFKSWLASTNVLYYASGRLLCNVYSISFQFYQKMFCIFLNCVLKNGEKRKKNHNLDLFDNTIICSFQKKKHI